MSSDSDNSNETLLLLDGHSLAFRAFYALPAANFSTTGGQYTNAVYGFIGMLLGLLEQHRPTHIAVAFDLPTPTFRESQFPEYKAQRPSTPEEFKGQIGLIRKALDAFGIRSIDKDSFEADDIIATLATSGEKAGMKVLICTGDRDSLQLVTENITVLYTLKGVSDLHFFTPEAVKEKYGVTPTQYPDLAALRGDTSDNMPGVPGVGPKTAQKWINEFGSLAGVLAAQDSIKGKVGENLRAHAADVQLARDITEMVRTIEGMPTLEELHGHKPEAAEIVDFFEELQFGTNLRKRVFRTFDIEFDVEPVIKVVQDQPALGGLGSWLNKYAGWKAHRPADDFKQHKPLTLALLGKPQPYGAEAELVCLLDEDYRAVVYDLADMNTKDEQNLALWLEDPEAPKWTFSGKQAWHILNAVGMNLRGVVNDVLIGSYLLRPDLRTYQLNDIIQRDLGKELSPTALEVWEKGTILCSGKNHGTQGLLFSDESEEANEDTPAELPEEAVAVMLEYAQAIAELTRVLVPKLESINALELYTDMEVPLALTLAPMEFRGIAVNVDILEELVEEYEQRIEHEVAEARALAGDDSLNLSSPKQLQHVLFENFGLPKTKKTKTGYSTAARELEKLALETGHPFLEHLMSHREAQKMKTTLDGLIAAISDDGRIHTTFNQQGSSTGRLSSLDPNLQNIPVRTPEGRRIRAAFQVGDGYAELITADYSQIEMRVMAHLSEDEGLITAYAQGEDLHNFVGSRVFDVPVDEVTPELRRRVKAMSYGLVYGLSAFGLSQQLTISPGEAKQIMESYFQRFGGVKRYLDSVVDKAKETGYTQTITGRRRYLPELNSTNRVARENAERAALNAPIQGSAADIIKIAMLAVEAELEKRGMRSRMLLQVHDELVIEAVEDEVEAVEELLVEKMDAAIELRVPLDVAAGRGKNWDEAAH